MRWRAAALLFLIFAYAGILRADPTTAVSATITDADGVAWAQGTYNIEFRPVPNHPGPYYYNGSSFDTGTTYSGNLDASGAFGPLAIPANTAISPSGSMWIVTVCPAATAVCYTKNFTITGTSQDLSSGLSPPGIVIRADSPGQPRFTAYTDNEIYGANWGFQYYNLTNKTFRICEQPATGTGSSPQCTWKVGGNSTSTSSGGSSPPADTCTVVGSFYIQTGGTPAVFVCTVVNGSLTWVQEPGTVTLVTTPPTTCTAGTWTYDTDTGQLWLGASDNSCTLISGNSGIAGTQNYITKFTLPNSVGDSSMTDDGTTVSLGGEPFSLSQKSGMVPYTNCSSGTTVGLLVKYDQTNGCIATVGTSDTSGAIGIVVSGAGTSGTAQVAQLGTVPCDFSNSTVVGDYVQISSGVAGNCQDAGSTYPTSGEVLGHVNSTNASAGTYAINIFSPDVGGYATVCKGHSGCGGGAGSVSSIDITGNGVSVASTTTGGPITTSGTINLPVPNVMAGTVNHGPTPTGVSTVSIVQGPTIAKTTSGGTLNASYGSPVTSGNTFLWIVSQEVSSPTCNSGGLTDSLGSSVTYYAAAGGAGKAGGYTCIGTGQFSSSGSDTVTYTAGIHNELSLTIISLGGTTGIDVIYGFPGTAPFTANPTTTADTDGEIVYYSCAQGSTTDVSIVPGISQVTYELTNPSIYVGVQSLGAAGAASVTATPTGCASYSTGGAYTFFQSGTEASGPLVNGPLSEAFLPKSAISQIQQKTISSLSSDFNITAGSDNTVTGLTQSLTMPSQGGPFIIQACYNLIDAADSSMSPIDIWIATTTTSGTELWGQWQSTTTDATDIMATLCQYSPSSYTDGEAVSVAIHVQTDGGATNPVIHAVPTAPSGGQNSSLQTVVLQSVN
jgi:hypothetical protein